MALLTKSRFALGLDCPAKLYYGAHPQEYPSTMSDDPFMAGMAEGRCQAGEFAKSEPGQIPFKP